MDNIIKSLLEKKWQAVKKFIKNNEIEWDYLLDQTNTPLHYLAYQGKTDLIKEIDKATIKNIIGQPNIEYNTVAHIATIMNNSELLKFVLDIDPQLIYSRNQLGCTPLNYVIGDENLIRDIVIEFRLQDHYIKKQSIVQQALIESITLVEYYILSKNINMIEFLLDNIRLNKSTEDAVFTTIKLDASDDYKLSILKLFVLHGVNINILDEKFLSPLIISVGLNLYSISKFLIEHGADINYSGAEGDNNLLTIAIKNSNIAIIKLLLIHNIRVNVRDKYLKTPIHYLFGEKNTIPLKIKRIFLSKIKNINTTDNQMNSILNLLVHNDNWKNYQNILVNRKLKIYLENRIGTMPIDGIQDRDMENFFNLVYESYINGLRTNVQWVDIRDQKLSLQIRKNNSISPDYTFYIMDKIKEKHQSYPIKKNSSTVLKLLVPRETNISHFSGYTYNYICYLLSFLKKYPSVKIPCMVQDQSQNKNMGVYYEELIKDFKGQTLDNKIFRSIIRDYINHWPGLINHVIIWKNTSMYFFSPYIVQGIHETIRTYPNIQFILLKLTILSANSNHANILIYDIKNKYVERFDPYGVVPFIDGKQMDEMLEVFFSDYFPNVKYLAPSKIVQNISFQIFSDERNENNYVENDPNGFCVAWCLWYLETRIRNIHIRPKSLISRTIVQINKNETKFKNYIRNYSNYLDNEKNLVLSNAGVPKKYWYSSRMPFDIYKIYLGYIRKSYDHIV